MAEKLRIKITYDPEDVGKQLISNRGKISTQRKYHMTKEEMKITKKRFKEEMKDVPQNIKDKAGSYFFNPYRPRGIYYSQLQALYLLGANEWHSYSAVRNKMEEFGSTVELVRRGKGYFYKTNVWREFEKKTEKPDAITSKDLFGRINENMIFFQRLSKAHPYGYKLYQVRSAIDIKRVSKEGFPNGLFFYRLSTYKKQEEAFPIKDNDNYISTNKRGRKVGSKNRKKKEELLVESFA